MAVINDIKVGTTTYNIQAPLIKSTAFVRQNISTTSQTSGLKGCIYVNVTIPTKSGYTPIALVNGNLTYESTSSGGDCYFQGCYMSSNTSATFAYSQSVNNQLVSLSADVLYVKNT